MLVFQTSVGGESSGSVSKCKLFSQAIVGCNLNGLRSGENLIILMFGRYLYKQSAFEIRFQLMEVLFSLKTYLKRSLGYSFSRWQKRGILFPCIEVLFMVFFLFDSMFR